MRALAGIMVIMADEIALDVTTEEAFEEIQRVKSVIDLKLKTPMFSTPVDVGIDIPLHYNPGDDHLYQLMEEMDGQGHRVEPIYEGDVPTSLRLFPYGGAGA